jgi:hypothetical protein
MSCIVVGTALFADGFCFSPCYACIVQEKELRTQHLENNRRIASLRRNALETATVRGELAEAQAQAEKERSVMTRWRKSKAYIPQGGRSGGTGAEGGHTTGGGGTGKAKAHIHRRKLGSY